MAHLTKDEMHEMLKHESDVSVLVRHMAVLGWNSDGGTVARNILTGRGLAVDAVIDMYEKYLDSLKTTV